MRIGWLTCIPAVLRPHFLCRFTTGNSPANRQMPIASVVMPKEAKGILNTLVLLKLEYKKTNILGSIKRQTFFNERKKHALRGSKRTFQLRFHNASRENRLSLTKETLRAETNSLSNLSQQRFAWKIDIFFNF